MCSNSMFRFSKEGSGVEGVEKIQAPLEVFKDAYQAAVDSLQQKADEHDMRERIRNASAAARLIEDDEKQGEALRLVNTLEARYRGSEPKDADTFPGGTADLRERLDEFLGGRD